MKHTILPVVIGLLMNSVCYSQTSETLLPQVVPPSPEAAALTKYGDIPVSLSAGIPQISVPLFTVSTTRLNLPLSLSYHAAGFRVDEVPTAVGLGWSLQAGGMISRSVVGKPDENTTDGNGMLFYDYSDMPSDCPTSDLISNRLIDNHSDIYNFNVGNISGKFMYNIETKQIVLTPSDLNVKITRDSTNNTFTLISEDGTIYRFEETETAESEINFTTIQNVITGWVLTKIISADLTDTIFLKYRSGQFYEELRESHSMEIGEKNGCISPLNFGLIQQGIITSYSGLAGGSTNVARSLTFTSHYYQLLDTIIFKNGYITIDYPSANNSWVERRIKEIKLYNDRGLLKSVEFIHGFWSYNNDTANLYANRLRLDSVYFKGEDSLIINKYGFDYNPNSLPPYRKSYYEVNCQVDHWGYYNANANKTLIPGFAPGSYSTSYDPTDYPAFNNYVAENREVNPAVNQACMLTKITYPTGGYTTFEYESNRAAGYAFSDYVGGLRIKQIKNFDSEGASPLIKTYVYGHNEDGMGTFIQSLNQSDFAYDRIVWDFADCGFANPAYDYSLNSFFTSSSSGSLGLSFGVPVMYEKVTEYIGTPDNNVGKTEYFYDFESNFSYPTNYDSLFVLGDTYTTDLSWSRGQLTKKRIYKYDNAGGEMGPYMLIQEDSTIFGELKTTVFDVGYEVDRLYLYRGITFAACEQGWGYTTFNYNDYYFIPVTYKSGVKKPLSTIVKTFDNEGNISTTTTAIAYSNLSHLYPTQTSTTNSKMQTIVTRHYYPQDKDNIAGISATPAYTALTGMVSKNIVAVNVQEEKLKDGNPVALKRTDFKEFATNHFLPQYVHMKVGANDAELRAEFLQYDTYGNILEHKKSDDIVISYLWDMKGMYPVAEVSNALNKDIYYTSFEEGDGNSSGNDSKTGRFSKTNGLTKSLSGLTNGDYVLSYWKKTGPAWVLNRNNVTITTGTYTINISSSDQVDEVRFYPVKALMTTYTYEPHVGVTSTCSISDKVAYYEYDNFSRLSLLRDEDKNIVKKYCYNYQGERQECSGIVYSPPSWQSTGLTRCKPCSANFNYTSNIRQHQEIDNNPSSNTYNTIRWVTDSISSSCAPPADWQNTNTALRCKVVFASNTSEREQEQRDLNPCSSTYYQTRWVVVDTNCTICPKPANWVSTYVYRCVVDANDENTGYQERQEVDTEPCSATYNDTVWVSNGYNATACPLPAGCTSENCAGVDKKCIDNICEAGVKVYSSSVYDANSGQYICTYHYEWSDSTWSQNFTEYSEIECPIGL